MDAMEKNATDAPGEPRAKIITPTPQAPNPNIGKAIVTVHGVGDQRSFATLQSVVNQFCHYFQLPAMMPLGSFNTGGSVIPVSSYYPRERRFETIAFAELYWAGVPRELIQQGYTLEESKLWGRTIVERARMRWLDHGADRGVCHKKDFERTELVLDEMITTVGVLERLSFLASQGGLFTFDLKKVLDDYLGDVQIVADFSAKRRVILDKFAELLTEVARVCPNAEIHVFAHSEGSVISFLGLLEAAERDPTGWIRQVHGLMTFGSPLDTHLLLWPSLFPARPPSLPAEMAPITWYNYYDLADPIGFGVQNVQQWLGSSQLFAFSKEDDMSFSRYPFPGKAHIDYWQDEAVFGHFIENVVKPEARAQPGTAEVEAPPSPRFSKPPCNRRVQQFLSLTLPYAGVIAALFLGVYLVCKALLEAINPDRAADFGIANLLRSAASMTVLLAGITAGARILRLARGWFWTFLAILMSALAVAAYWQIWKNFGGNSILMRAWPQTYPRELWFAAGFAIFTLIFARAWPGSGMRPLLWPGVLAIALLVYFCVSAAEHHGPVWPLVLATAAFAYLWWLAALTFDLIFVWHRHIRKATLLHRLHKMTAPSVR